MPEGTSEQLKDLIAKMLTVNPEDRFSAKQCLEHAWFHGDCEKKCKDETHVEDSSTKVSKQVINRLRKFRHGSKLRIALLNILVKQIHAE